MKKSLLVIFLAFMALTLQAQYRTYKNQYDVKDYSYQSTDHYNPKVASLLSVLMPGLGHFAIGEPLRGLGYVFLASQSLAITFFGLSQFNEFDDPTLAGVIFGTGAALFTITYVSGIIDVSKMAKIKNMHFRDQKLSLHLYPSFQLMPNENLRLTNATGLTMAVNF